jgi:Ser/Thr protein kinase RdoA (MazF antagonist)
MPEQADIDTYTPAAQAALKAFPIDPVDLELVLLSENVTFKVKDRTRGAPFVLRLHRPGYHTLDELKSEPLWTQALNDAGIAAPVPLTARSGEHYVPVIIPSTGEQRHAGMASWTEGELLSDIMEATGDAGVLAGYFGQLGGVLAALHNQACAWRAPASFTRHMLDAEGLMGAVPFWGPFWEHPAFSPVEQALLKRTRNDVHAMLGRYGKDPSQFSLIHADLHPGNILVGQEGLTVIDFDDAGFGWHVYDIAVALKYFQTEPGFEALQAALLKGYRAVRPLSDLDAALIPTFIMIRRMAQVGWLYQRPEIDAAEFLAEAGPVVCQQCAEFRALL